MLEPTAQSEPNIQKTPDSKPSTVSYTGAAGT